MAVGPNPNPERITSAMWLLWAAAEASIPGVRLGGIYGDKPGYHNTVNANRSKWPREYSTQLPLDLDAGPWDKARAIDLTMSEVEMRRRTGYLKRAADHPEDDRLRGLREFIGTIDGDTVFCYIRDTDSGPWTFDGGRDTTHLWHIHLSVWTTYCATWEVLAAVASVLAGETWEQWQQRHQQGEDEGMAARFTISSSDPAWNGKMVIGSGTERFTARNPGAIQNTLRRIYPTATTLADADRGSLPWESFLDGVLGPDLAAQAAAVAARLDAILAAALDDGQVDITASPQLIALIKGVADDIKAETRDAVADLGEGGAEQVREDAP